MISWLHFFHSFAVSSASTHACNNSMSCHVMLFPISCHVVFISCHAILCHAIMSCHFMSYHFMSCHRSEIDLTVLNTHDLSYNISQDINYGQS